MTMIRVLCVGLESSNPVEQNIFQFCGYGDIEQQKEYIIMYTLNKPLRGFYSPYDWNDRTYQTAHDFIIKNWNHLISGDIVDVEYILKEKVFS